MSSGKTRAIENKSERRNAANEEARLAALYSYQILDTPPEPAFDALTRLAAHLCATPVAVMSLVDRERQWFKSKVGWHVSEIPREVGVFCAQTLLQPDFFVVSDAYADERFARTPLVARAPHARFYAGVPLVTPEGYALGTLCVIDQVVRRLNSEQVDALCALGREAMLLLDAWRKSTSAAR